MPTSLTSLGITFPDSSVQCSALPIGIIAMWSGLLQDLPSGWKLCDGNNGTPNLSNRFIIGSGLSYSQNQTGGCADQSVAQHTHTISLNSVGSHIHDTGGSSHSHPISGNILPGGEHNHNYGYEFNNPSCTLAPWRFCSPGECRRATGFAGCHFHDFNFVTDNHEHIHPPMTTTTSGAHAHPSAADNEPDYYLNPTISSGGSHQHGLGCSGTFNVGPGSVIGITPTSPAAPGASTQPFTAPLYYCPQGPGSIYPDTHYHSGTHTAAGEHTHNLCNQFAGGHFHRFCGRMCTSNHLTHASFHTHCFANANIFVDMYLSEVHRHCFTTSLSYQGSSLITCGDHNHQVSFSSAGIVTGEGRNMPPYFVLAYIMKV